MKRAAVLLVLAIPLALFSACKTKPKPPEEVVEEPVETPVEKPVELPAEKPKEPAPAKPAEAPFAEPAAVVLAAVAKPASPAAPVRPLAAPTANVTTKPVAKPLAKPQEKPRPVADSDVQKAREAVARAKAADAAYYEADLYRGATADLDAGLRARSADPDQCRALLASTVDKASRAYDGSVRKAAAEMEARWKTMDAKLLAVAADRFAAADYRAAGAQWSKAASMYAGAAGDITSARAEGYAALKAQTDLYDRLAARLASVEVLRKEVGKYLDEAEQARATEWAPKEYAETTRLYLLGVEAFQSYRLDETEEYYGAAREAAKLAASLARSAREQTEAQKRAEAERVMKEVMAELEAASRMTVVTDDGTVILPEEWSGEDILKEIEKLDASGSGQSLAIPTDGTTVVLGDGTTVSLLDQAKELWRKGLVEKDAGNYQKAMGYFEESKRYVAAYRAQAVKAVYTVRLVPERRDCLWRIAEYDYVYGNPYLWPKIWRRNRKLIQNPDLVYPGWLLIIPPED